MDGRMGSNINGPSLVRVPGWVSNPLGRYYLYFADHRGTYIRLAYADALAGPWTAYEPGSLQLAGSCFPTEAPTVSADGVPSEFLYAHIASPDVHVDDDARQFRMYYHGMLGTGRQMSRVALSVDGVTFEAREEVLALPYLRMFRHGGWHYGMAMPGVCFRSRDGLSGFERGPVLFERDTRHSALLVLHDRLHVFWTRAGDAPERILCTTIDLRADWHEWRASPPVDVLAPEEPWEGADLPIAPSLRGAIDAPAHQLRDPAIYEEEGRTYLLYSVAGESGIAIAEVFLDG
jgi:hypothetical protein